MTLTSTRAGHARLARSRTGARQAVPVALLAALSVLVLAGCSRDDGSTTTSTTTTTEAPPSTVAPERDQPVEGPEEPPAVEWVVQIGGSADDALLGVAARDDRLLAGGYTEGDLAGAPVGGRDVLLAAVGTDSEVRALHQFGSSADDVVTGVASAADATVICGHTAKDLGAAGAGLTDAWCAPVDPDASPGAVNQQGGTEDDQLSGVALATEGDLGYAGGFTRGLFPGASDTSAGSLGEGDALIWQIDPDGTPRWIRQFGTTAEDQGQGIATTADGDGLLVGSTQGALDGPSLGATDGFLARFDREGLPRFVRQFGTVGTDLPRAVASGGEATRGTETFVTVGSTDGAFAPALGAERTDTAELPRADGAEPAPSNAGGTDAMVLAVDPGGGTRWAAQLGSDGADTATGVAVDGSTVLVAGTTSGVLDTTGSPAAGGKDGFLAALDLETGALRWITQFGSDGDEEVTGMTTTEDGLVVVSGHTTGALGDQPNAGGTDGFLIAFPLPASGGSVASAL